MAASFSAVDDDSVEGGHYLWQLDEVQSLLTEEEFELFKSEIAKILKSHHKFGIKILNLPIIGGEDIEGDPIKFQAEIERIYSLPIFTETEKFKGFSSKSTLLKRDTHHSQ